MSGDEDVTAAGLGFWGGLLLKRETIFCALAVGAAVAYRDEPEKLSWVPRIFDGASAIVADPKIRGKMCSKRGGWVVGVCGGKGELV